MVRLKLQLCTAISRKLKTSQFHYGSIKTEKGETIAEALDSLNSTMVRLKPLIMF